MQQNPDVRRHADGPIDVDFYRRRAARLRRHTNAVLLRLLTSALSALMARCRSFIAHGAGRGPRITTSARMAGRSAIERATPVSSGPEAAVRTSGGTVMHMSARIEEACGSIDYAERGRGPTVVLVPGSCSTGAAWRPVISQWQESFRSVTTSLLGYGGTAERRTGFDTEISDEAEILESVIRRAACPVHLVGHSFGGLVALAVALRNRVPLLSLTIVEAPAAELLHHVGEDRHYRAFREMTGAYFAAFYGGETAAIKTMIDFYGGAGTFASWPERVRNYAVETTAVNILDWADVYGFELTPARLAAIDIPTLVVLGGTSHPAVQRANRLLAQCVGGAAVVTVPDAAHFMISTHAPAVARVIARHVARAEWMNRSAAA